MGARALLLSLLSLAACQEMPEAPPEGGHRLEANRVERCCVALKTSRADSKMIGDCLWQMGMVVAGRMDARSALASTHANVPATRLPEECRMPAE